ncbi:unnamed protein product [Ilex paraguariensis]|uniref:DUF4283 domain-containing protein n=1 Tax=Ilex paraguariensis TaxID=185542 RepID=A0ABC8T6B2_9AQUA
MGLIIPKGVTGRGCEMFKRFLENVIQGNRGQENMNIAGKNNRGMSVTTGRKANKVIFFRSDATKVEDIYRNEKCLLSNSVSLTLQRWQPIVPKQGDCYGGFIDVDHELRTMKFYFRVFSNEGRFKHDEQGQLVEEGSTNYGCTGCKVEDDRERVEGVCVTRGGKDAKKSGLFTAQITRGPEPSIFMSKAVIPMAIIRKSCGDEDKGCDEDAEENLRRPNEGFKLRARKGKRVETNVANNFNAKDLSEDCANVREEFVVGNFGLEDDVQG